MAACVPKAAQWSNSTGASTDGRSRAVAPMQPRATRMLLFSMDSATPASPGGVMATSLELRTSTPKEAAVVSLKDIMGCGCKLVQMNLSPFACVLSF